MDSTYLCLHRAGTPSSRARIRIAFLFVVLEIDARQTYKRVTPGKLSFFNDLDGITLFLRCQLIFIGICTCLYLFL
jgi:hypothetical protein